MKNWIIILLALLVVIAGAFLPELLLGADSLPELDLDYGQVSVTSQSSSGYTWRMEQIGEKYFGEGEHLLSTYISEEGPEQQSQEGYAQFREELGQLMDLGVIPQNIETLLEEKRDYHIRYYYLFDNESVSGFRIAEFTASAANWRISACMDVESGKLAKVEYGGSRLIPGGTVYPQSSWYDVLRGYAQYLGLDTTPNATPEAVTPTLQQARHYYDSITVDKWTSPMVSGDSAWMELRVLREDYLATIAVYHGGK